MTVYDLISKPKIKAYYIVKYGPNIISTTYRAVNSIMGDHWGDIILKQYLIG